MVISVDEFVNIFVGPMRDRPNTARQVQCRATGPMQLHGHRSAKSPGCNHCPLCDIITTHKRKAKVERKETIYCMSVLIMQLKRSCVLYKS